jgi:hypothetical protein
VREVRTAAADCGLKVVSLARTFLLIGAEARDGELEHLDRLSHRGFTGSELIEHGAIDYGEDAARDLWANVPTVENQYTPDEVGQYRVVCGDERPEPGMLTGL